MFTRRKHFKELYKTYDTPPPCAECFWTPDHLEIPSILLKKNASLHDNGLSHITAHSTYSIMVYWLIALEAGSVHSKIYETTLPDDPR